MSPHSSVGLSLWFHPRTHADLPPDMHALHKTMTPHPNVLHSIMYQAIEVYLAQIAPDFASLTPQQRGKDTQFLITKEEVAAKVAGLFFGGKTKAENDATFGEMVDKLFPILEGWCPESGFVNGTCAILQARLAA